jgi:cystathionine beta-synthase
MANSVYTRNILEAVGDTPLIKLNRITAGLDADIFAKLEYFNPMGSIKDRIAKFMVEKAESEGRIKPGDTIIDNSSGNTALGLAMVCSVKGYRLKMVVRDSISSEKIKFLRALNVDLHMVDNTLPPDSPDSYNNITPRLAAADPDLFHLDQHNCRDNNETHYRTTGPEIWEQMDGNIDYFVTGIGTGGTVCGVSRFLKERDPSIRVVAVDPVGSIFYDYFHTRTLVKPSRYVLEGLGDEFLIGCVDFSLIDDMVRVTDKDAFLKTRELANREVILAGGSSGASILAAIQVAKEAGAGARIVTVFPDSANRYLSSIYNDEWLRVNGYWPR